MIVDQSRAPVAEAVERYVKENVTRFHMPGHKGGREIAERTRQVMGNRVFELDITSVQGMDDLLQPRGVIKQAEQLLAQAFGADDSYFLINGTSSGLQALILTSVANGDEILVPRNMHKSMVAGLVLSGARPVFLVPEVSEQYGIALGITPKTLTEALEQHPAAKAALLINPTYYGTVCDLQTLAGILHDHDLPLLIDEAHGAHFYFHDALPAGSMPQGADAVAQGAHKTLGSLTQSSWLHVRGARVDKQRLEASLSVLLSTSASYVLLASLDLARRQMALEGEHILERTMELAIDLSAQLKELPGLIVLDDKLCTGPAAIALDPTKVTVNVSGLGLTGQEVEMILRYSHNIQVELSDWYNVLFMVGPGNSHEDVEAVVKAFQELTSEYGEKKTKMPTVSLPALPRQIITPREAFFAPADLVNIEHSVGRISTEAITCYPPGIPVLCPGELITAEVAEYVTCMLGKGYKVQGLREGGSPQLRVAQEQC